MARIVIVLVALATVLLASSSLSAQGLDERNYKRLARIHELMGETRYDEARQGLDALYPSVKNKPFAKALVLQTYGYLYASQEKYDQAIDYLRRSLALKVLPEGATQNVRFNLAQLYMGKGDYKATIAELAEWFKRENDPAAKGFGLRGTAYAQLKQYVPAIADLKRFPTVAELATYVNGEGINAVNAGIEVDIDGTTHTVPTFTGSDCSGATGATTAEVQCVGTIP